MHKTFVYNILIVAWFCLFYGSTYGQLIDFDREKPYLKVFVDTDNFGASYLKQLEEAYTKTNSDTLTFSILNDLAYYWHTRNLTKALAFTKEGLALSSQKNDTLWHGRFQITQGAILLRQEKSEEAYSVLTEAATKVTNSDLAFLNTQLGYVFERRGELGKAADYALESLRLGKETNDLKAQALAYSDLSNLFWKQSKFDKGLEYGLKSLELFEKRGINDLDYDFTLYVVGNNYLSLHNYEKALNYYQHAKAIGERYGFYNNLSDVYISLVDLYALLNNYQEAEKAGIEAIKYAELLDNEFMLMRSWLSVGKLQYLQGKFLSAIESVTKCIEIATVNFGDEFYLSQAYQTLGKSYAGNHNYKEAYEAFAKYDSLKNQIFTAEADQRISKLQTEFDVAQKESTILEQEVKLKQQKTRQSLITIIAVLLFFMLVILFKSFQNNKQKNLLLKQQNQEKEFLLKEIHHRVKNNLEIVSSLLALQSAQIQNADMVNVMNESQNRVQSMSIIHQRLYQGKNLSTIEMRGYFMSLGRHVLGSFGASNRIKFYCKMKKLELDVDTAIPLGLIVNELLTNALKYAFPENKTGKINVALDKEGDANLVLKVSDNGIGRLQKSHINGTGFGTQLISLLSKQLNGTMQSINKKGTAITFQFKQVKAI